MITIRANPLPNEQESQGMKPAPFRYFAPKSLDEALSILAEVAPEDGRVLAGGQSLVPTMAFRMARPAHLIDINNVAGLDRLALENGKLCIGACVRHAAFERPMVDDPLGRLLATVVRHIAHPPIRSRGTFCGSVAMADPASEWCMVSVGLGAEMVARSRRGTRVIPASEFFAGIMTAALEEDELLVEVRLPLLPAGTRFGFYEFSRRAGDFAIAMGLTLYRLEGGRMAEQRVAIGAEPHPRRIAKAEETFAGKTPANEAFAAAADAAAAAVEPMTDAINDGEFQRDLVRVVTRLALERSVP
jgi:carbon-monoxide dehydrogenase medium subunit